MPPICKSGSCFPRNAKRTLAASVALAAVWVMTADANAAWEAPVEIASSSQATGGGGSPAAALGLYAGNAVVAYRPTEQSVAVRHRDHGSAEYGPPQSLGETSGSNKLSSPAVAVGTGGEALAAWIFETPKTSEEAVPCATRAAAAPTFSPCASDLLGPPGLSEGNWRMGDLQAAANGSGTVALSVEGPGSSGYAFSRPFGVYGSLAHPPAATALTGNIGLEESGRENRPEVALNAAGDAVTAWTGWPENPREVVVDYRDHAGSGWGAHGHSGERVYCCSFMGPGDYRLAIDGLGNGYVLIHGGAGGGESNEGILFAYASRSYALGGEGPWGVQQQLDKTGTQPRIAVDSAGDATAIWIDKDPETGHDALFAAYRPAGAETRFGPAAEVTVAPGSGQISGDEVYVAPAGNVLIAWMTCPEAACGKHEVQARTRAAGGGSFGAAETVQEAETGMGGLTLAGDPQGDVLLGWSEGGSNAIFASMYTPPPPPPPPPSEGGSPGSSSSNGSGGGSASPVLSLLGAPSARGTTVAFTLNCRGAVGEHCATTATLNAAERLIGRHVVGISTPQGRRANLKQVTIGFATVSLVAGAEMTVQVRLNATGRKLLARFHKLPVGLTVTLTNAASHNAEVVFRQTVVLKSPKQRRPH